MNQAQAQEIADKVLSEAKSVQSILTKMHNRMHELNAKIADYDKFLCALDHELEITVLTAPQLSRVLAHRKRVLNERRFAKHEYLLYRRFDNNLNLEKGLSMTSKGIAYMKKAPTDVVNKNQGLIDSILAKGGETHVKSDTAAS